MAGVVRPYRGVSAAERHSRRRAQLIEAALDVIGEAGIAGATMTAVCARAGLTERYFYESFRDRQELLVAVFDACVAELDAAIAAAREAAAPTLLDRARAAAGALIEVLTDDPRKSRLYAESVGEPALAPRRAQAVRAYAALLAESMRELGGVDEERRRAPLDLAALVLVGGIAEAVASWLEGTVEMSRATLIEEWARLSVAALEAVGPTARS
ncbi:MAG TPA: TetR/AcrR family transcriptional regulator [Solirubrobacteraceae bacterium]|nr:TetR/AcrR family transcriptional regulator [Solirubrobacteraceae bacterium]